MAKYNEQAKFFADLVKDKNRLKAQIAGSSNIVQIGKRDTEVISIEVLQVKVRTNTGGAGYVTVVQRGHLWKTKSDFERGSKTSNISLASNDVRLAV